MRPHEIYRIGAEKSIPIRAVSKVWRRRRLQRKNYASGLIREIFYRTLKKNGDLTIAVQVLYAKLFNHLHVDGFGSFSTFSDFELDALIFK